MIVALFNAIAAIPAILNLCKQFVTWMSSQVEAAEKRKLAADMAKAADVAKQTKDTSQLDHMFDPDKEVKK